MTEDEMKNRISLALKNPILQQGFEIICKNLAELKTKNAELKEIADRDDNIIEALKKQIAEMDLYSDKAIELLKTFLLIADNKVSQMEFQLCVADAKQFLNEVEHD